MPWYETIMEIVSDPYFHQGLCDAMIILATGLGLVFIAQAHIIADLKKQIEERDNLIDYYYHEEDLKIK